MKNLSLRGRSRSLCVAVAMVTAGVYAPALHAATLGTYDFATDGTGTAAVTGVVFGTFSAGSGLSGSSVSSGSISANHWDGNNLGQAITNND